LLDQLLQVSDRTEIWWDALPSTHAARGSRSGFRDPDEPSNGLLTGSTSNWCRILDAIMADRPRWEGIARSAGDGHFEAVCLEALRYEAAILHPLWERSEGRHGWVCAQLPPTIAYDEAAMIGSGRRYAAVAPNVMVKVPASAAGIGAVEMLTAHGVATNATLSFSVAQAIAGLEAVRRGLVRRGGTPPRWRAVHSFMAARLGRESAFADEARAGGVTLDRNAIRGAEMAVFNRIHHMLTGPDMPLTVLLCSIQIDDDRCPHLEQATGASAVITLTPSLLAELERLPVRPWAASVLPSRDVMAQLMTLPYFRAAYEPGGLAPDAFGSQPAFVAGLAEQHRAYNAGVEWAAAVRAGRYAA